jgi:hypothetical protein
MTIQRANPDDAKTADSWAERLRQKAAALERHRRAEAPLREARDRDIVEAYDAHHTVAEIARAALMVKSRVEQIVAENSAAEGRQSA